MDHIYWLFAFYLKFVPGPFVIYQRRFPYLYFLVFFQGANVDVLWRKVKNVTVAPSASVTQQPALESKPQHAPVLVEVSSTLTFSYIWMSWITWNMWFSHVNSVEKTPLPHNRNSLFPNVIRVVPPQSYLVKKHS